jgi:catechol 2,3-dioxygenase-like lactoylglutathione lyase family enzyme
MIHHIAMFVSEFAASREFFATALAPLGVVIGYEGEGVCEFWRASADTPSLSLAPASGDITRGLHLAFDAADRDSVDAFFAAAIASGGREREAARYRPHYGAYCAFVSDTDGNNIEAVHKEAPPRATPTT